ncbi:MAG: hypothetical protein RLZZ136_319 [Pseudomonadota bacterium]|jgi:methyl coenzyme M reductase alpha subunit
MNGLIGDFRIGEDIAIALDATLANATEVSSLSAVMKPAQLIANRFVVDDAASGITMAVAAQQPAANGWLISLSHSQSASLIPGIYGVDARLMIGGSVAMTEQTAFIRLSKATVA